eukprot:171281-Alexandrium_andersonii.AAC.1
MDPVDLIEAVREHGRQRVADTEIVEARKFIRKVFLADGSPVRVQIHPRKTGTARGLNRCVL